MTFVPIMWIVWSAFVCISAALYIYRLSLTKNEEDQIFLDDSFLAPASGAGGHRRKSSRKLSQ